jgi:hypothetical protein
MTPDQVVALAAAGESATLEFKKSTAEKDRACRAVCAFANGQGGRVLFGVTPAGKVVGQTVSDGTLEELAQEFQGFEPPLFPEVERVPVDGGREVLVLTVARGAHVPVAFRGVAYERVLNTTRILPRETFQRLLLEEMHATERWENRPAVGWSVSDLDHEEIRRTLEAGIQAGRIEEPTTRDPLEVLRGLGLVKHDALLRAAVVLFGRADRLLPDFLPSVSSGWRASGEQRRGSSSTTASSTATHSRSFSARNASFGITCRLPGTSSRDAWSVSTRRRTRRWHSAKQLPTRSVTATTPRAEAPSGLRCTTIALK